MTTLLARAFEKASDLPETLQDDLAIELMQELEWEQKWNTTLESSSAIIDDLALEALKEFKNGKTKESDLSDL